MDIVSGLSAIKTAADLARAIRDAAKAGTLKPDEFAGRVAEVYDYIADSKEALFSVQEQMSKLQAEVGRLRMMVFHHSVNWRRLPDESEDGPYCPVCVSEGIDMRLVLRDHADQRGEILHLQCPKTHAQTGQVRDLGRGRDPVYSIPKQLLPSDRYFIPA